MIRLIERGLIMLKFVIKETKTGVKFDINTLEEETVARSGVFKDEDACFEGIQSVRDIAQHADYEFLEGDDYRKANSPKYEVYVDRAKKFRFRLKGSNDKNILASVPFETKEKCDVTVGQLRDHTGHAEVEK